MGNAKKDRQPKVGGDLRLERIERRTSGGGAWARGTLNGHRFEALCFPEHAENPDYEIGQSRISKLWLSKLSNKETSFNWDRGLDVPAASQKVQAVVDFLAAGLADYVYAR